MAVLTDLPPENLEQIYHFLGSIDDAHHLGRTFIQHHNIYLEIMRSIIYSSPQHRYDFQLNKALILHSKIVAHFAHNTSRLPASQPGANRNNWEYYLHNMASACSSPQEWTDDAVCDVLARYQGLRMLQNTWLERELQEQDFLSVDHTSDAQRLVHRFQTLVGRGEEFAYEGMPPRDVDTPHTWCYRKFNVDQRGRFYAAVVCVWLLNEIRWVLTNFTYPANFTVQIGILESCKSRILAEADTPLLDELDRHAVFAFMYQHLLPLHASFFADATSTNLPFTFVSDFSKDWAHCPRYVPGVYNSI
ncbi:hypothetical protein J4E91_006481 [Alternaria rosae]|nr:hypothetical protein J4E91_006481 [Alternaria rosae]